VLDNVCIRRLDARRYASDPRREDPAGEALQHRGKNLLRDGFYGSVVADGQDPLRVAPGYLLVLGVDPLVERVVFAFEAVLVAAVTLDEALVAAAGPVQRGGERWQEQDGEFRLKTVADRRPGRPRRSRCNGHRGRQRPRRAQGG